MKKLDKVKVILKILENELPTDSLEKMTGIQILDMTIEIIEALEDEEEDA